MLETLKIKIKTKILLLFELIDFKVPVIFVAGHSAQNTVNKIHYTSIQMTFESSKRLTRGRPLLSTRTDAISPVRSFWPQAISYYLIDNPQSK